MIQYEEVQLEAPSQLVIKRTDPDGKIFWIPKNEDNSDYQEYLKWMEENNEQN